MKLILFVVFLAGCAGTGSKAFVAGDQAPENIRKKFVVAETPADCRKAKGNWMGVANNKAFPKGGYCMFKTHDGGRRCRVSSDCESYCEMSVSDFQESSVPRCSGFAPPRWDRCVPGYYEAGKVLGRGECFGEDSEVQ